MICLVIGLTSNVVFSKEIIMMQRAELKGRLHRLTRLHLDRWNFITFVCTDLLHMLRLGFTLKHLRLNRTIVWD